MKVDMETRIAREQKQFKNQLALLSHYAAENAMAQAHEMLCLGSPCWGWDWILRFPIHHIFLASPLIKK